MQHTFTLRPTPGLKGCFDILRDGQLIAQTFGRAAANNKLKDYRSGKQVVRSVEPDLEYFTHNDPYRIGSGCHAK